MVYVRFGVPIKSTEVALARPGEVVQSIGQSPKPEPALMKSATTLSAVRVASSNIRDPMLAATNLASQLSHENLGCVLFFCSAEYDLSRLGASLERVFAGVSVCGCTSAGEITPEGYGRGCITAIGFDQRYFAIGCALISELESFSLQGAQDLIDGLLSTCKTGNIAPVKGNTFAITLHDGLSSREELVLATLNSALGTIPHFGGSAGDDERLANTHVFYNGRFHTRAAGVAFEDLDRKTFALRPMAVKIGNHYFIRSIQRVNPDKSLTFYCAVETGIVMTAMAPGPLLDNLRRLEAELTGVAEETSAFLKTHKVIGFNTYGEQFEGMHINQDIHGGGDWAT